ncbi:MAG: ABC transporter substrate-binding protein [Clostridiales bacterium]|jgi:putative aldouronate transport system substrate-binding protein|nr:ABC transporter substrate-binding protein [Clostridiales bacterium]
MKKCSLIKCTALAFAALMLAACGAPAASAEGGGAGQASASAEAVQYKHGWDLGKEVNLKMFLLGDKAADFDLVYGKINEELKKQINTTLEVEFLSWAEHDAKYSLLFSSGEEFDLIFTGTGWAHYEPTATKMGFYEMTDDFRRQYAPDIMSFMPEDAWEHAKISGKVFMVPNYNIEIDYSLLGLRGDLMEKYGFSDIASTEQLEAFFDAICENEEGISPLGTQGLALQWIYLIQQHELAALKSLQPLFLYHYTEPENIEVVSIVERPEFREYARKMKEMQTKGYWSKDALSTTDTRTDNFIQGRAASMGWTLGNIVTACVQMNADHPDWKATFADITPQFSKPSQPYSNNGMAINAISKNPERSMITINELMTNKTTWDLACYGIDGVHYQAVGDDRYIPLADSSRYPAFANGNWGWTNEPFKRKLYSETPDPLITKQEETTEKWNASVAAGNPLITFSMNEEVVKSQIAVINTLITQYMDPISTGLVDDPDAAVDEFLLKLNEAGLQEVHLEMQKQADAWAAEH